MSIPAIGYLDCSLVYILINCLQATSQCKPVAYCDLDTLLPDAHFGPNHQVSESNNSMILRLGRNSYSLAAPITHSLHYSHRTNSVCQPWTRQPLVRRTPTQLQGSYRAWEPYSYSDIAIEVF